MRCHIIRSETKLIWVHGNSEEMKLHFVMKIKRNDILRLVFVSFFVWLVSLLEV